MLYRKYRPWEFQEITGHNEATSILKKEFETGIKGSFLIIGKAGTGKTSIARIAVSSLFCQKKQNGIACGKCSDCKKVMKGLNKEVIEIDLNTSKGKELFLKSLDNPKIKAFIVENLHTVSKEEIENIIKIYNEKRSDKLFLFTTENRKKIPVSFLKELKIIKLISNDGIGTVELLLEICSKEKFNITEEALQIISKKTGGNITYALQILERAVKLFPENCTSEEMAKIIAAPSEKVVKSFYKTLLTGNRERILEWIEKSDEAGLDIIELLRKLEDYISEDILGQNINFTVKLLEAISETAGILENFPRMHNIFYGQYFVTRLFPCGSGELPESIVQAEKFDEIEEEETGPFIEESKKIMEDENLSPEERAIFEEIGTEYKIKTKFEDILKKWPEFLKEVSRNNTSLGIGMKFSLPEKIKNNRLVISFPPDSEFLFERTLERAEDIKVIEKILYVFFLEKIRVSLKLLTVEEKIKKDFEL